MQENQSIKELNQERIRYNRLLESEDDFFANFSSLDTEAYTEGKLTKQTKELIGLTISIISGCDECIVYHLQECKVNGVSNEEIIEVLKLAIIGGGSIMYPKARLTVKLLHDLTSES